MLLSMLAMMLLLTAAYSSLVFVEKKEYNWNFNYALGQQFATIAKAAHLYVQTVAYDPDFAGHPQRAAFLAGSTAGGNAITVNDLIANGFLPVNFPANIGGSQNKYQNIQITAFSEVIPRGGGPNAASTAFVVMDIDVDAANNRQRTGADIAAFRAGAASRGLARMGIPVLMGGGANCGVNPNFVRWGDNPSDCLSTVDVDAITNTAGFAGGLDQNDAIAPAWEIVTETEDLNAVFRYPQPNRPDAQIMNTALNMTDTGGAAHNVTNIDYSRVINDMTITGDMTINVTTNNLGSLNVTGDSVLAGNATTQAAAVQGGAVTYDGDASVNTAIANAGVTVGSAATPAELAITNGGLNESAGHDAILTIDDGAGTGRIDIVTLLQEQDPIAGSGLTLDLQGGNDLVVTGQINHFGGGTFRVNGNGGTSPGNFQAISADINLPGNNMTLVGADRSSASGNIVVDDITLNNNATFGSMTFNNVGQFNVGQALDINVDCFGAACPDAVTDPPADPF